MNAMPWWRSHSFTALWQTSVLTVLFWLTVAFSTNTWHWRQGLVVPLLSNIFILCKSWWSPNIAGPMNFMNREPPK